MSPVFSVVIPTYNRGPQMRLTLDSILAQTYEISMQNELCGDLISVVIPVYNRGPLIQKTLDSVLAQTLAPLEILVVDDGSTDGTPDWIEAHYGESVTLIRQPNGGVARARNRGLEEARGQYIAFCDHDDEWLPHKLELQMETARNYPNAALVGCNWRDVDENGEDWGEETWAALYRDWRPVHGEAYDWICSSPCPLISMTLPLLHAEKLRSIGGFDPRCVPCDDWDVYLRLAHRFPFEWCEETLAFYVHHASQQSGDGLPLHAAMRRVLSKQWPAILSHPKSLRFWWSFSLFLDSWSYYSRAKSGLSNGRRGTVLLEFARVAARYPLALTSKQWLYLMFRLVRGRMGPY